MIKVLAIVLFSLRPAPGDSTDLVVRPTEAIQEWFVVAGNGAGHQFARPLAVAPSWSRTALSCYCMVPEARAEWPCGICGAVFEEQHCETDAPWTLGEAVVRFAGAVAIGRCQAVLANGDPASCAVEYVGYEPCSAVAVRPSSWSAAKELYR